MKIYKFLLVFILAGGIFTSCSKDDNDVVPPELPDGEQTVEQTVELEIKNFEYSAMDVWYFYKDGIPEYNDDFFATQNELDIWLDGFDSPEDLFYNGLVDESRDEFSWIVDDFEALENRFAGVRTTTGINFGLAFISSNSDKVAGIIRYIIPGSPADMEGLKRGMIFTEIDGQALTESNFRTLLGAETLTFGFSDFNETGNLELTGETVTLTKAEINENPINVAKTINLDGIKVGYLMYNSFTHAYDDELNDAFAQFKADGVTELVLDLRYNGGGRVSSAVDLASMITGQFNGEIIIRTEYNDFLESQFSPESLVTKFDNQIFEGEGVNAEGEHANHIPQTINSLNLDKVYVIATSSSASASELVINGLAPYIEVVHIGTKTVGKVQASVTLYDAEFPYTTKENLNPNHKYALQPLISTSTNADGEAFPDGLIPDIEQREFFDTYGTLGDPEEPLLAIALNQISSNRALVEASKKGKMPMNTIGESLEDEKSYQNMYIDHLPKIDLNK